MSCNKKGDYARTGKTIICISGNKKEHTKCQLPEKCAKQLRFRKQQSINVKLPKAIQPQHFRLHL